MPCTTVPGRPPTPATRTETPVRGWNAGANSVAMLDGEVRLFIPAPNPAVGIVIGLKSSRFAQTVPELVEFAWWFITDPVGTRLAHIGEMGERIGGFIQYAPDDEFTIIRCQGIVAYYRNGQLVRYSSKFSSGELVTNACMYMTGDTLP